MAALNKRGASWLAWILITALFISVSASLIIWGKIQTSESAEETMIEVEGNIQCRDVRIKADKLDGCIEIEVENKGMINIKHLDMWINEENSKSGPIPVQQAITLNNPVGTDKVSLLPVIEVDGKAVNCQEKKLRIDCE